MENNNFTDFQLKYNHDGLLQTSGTKVRVRCPQCFKLFSINAQSVNEARPRFACSSCETQFWIPFPECLEQEELLGFPVSWLDEGKEDISTHLRSSTPAAAAVRNFDMNETELACPKCGQKHSRGAEECLSCGVIFSKFRESTEDVEAGFKVTRQLREAWKVLINDFDKPALHEEFLQLCRKEQALDYAAYRYGRVYQACPEDEVSKSMLSKIETIIAVSSSVESQDSSSKREPQRHLPWYSRFRISTVIISLGCLLMAVGYFLPAFRNIVGLGAATVFLAAAFRMYFPKN